MSTNLKRFLIHCSTKWCGMDDTFRAVAEKEEDLWELADQLAYENFNSYGGTDLILEDYYDTENMSEDEIETILEDVEESDYYYDSNDTYTYNGNFDETIESDNYSDNYIDVNDYYTNEELLDMYNSTYKNSFNSFYEFKNYLNDYLNENN